jgi:hypothetical protein
MFYYVEYLRAMRALRVAGIILGILLLTAIIFRLTVHFETPQAWISDIEHSPTAHVTEQKLPDGGTRTIVDDPQKHTHAVIVRHGFAFTMDLTEPAGTMRESHHHDSTFGSMSTDEETRGGMDHVTVRYRPGNGFQLGALFLLSLPIGLVVSTILAGTLAKENDGHLELVWTKPVSRERMALAYIAVDVVTIVISQLLTIVTMLLAVLLFMVPRITAEADSLTWVGFALLAAISWYAVLTAASASLKRGPGLTVGLGWLAGILILGLSAATEHLRPALQWIHAILQGLAYLDPLAYFSMHDNSFSGNGIITSIAGATLALAALSILYFVLSVLQWRRVEA